MNWLEAILLGILQGLTEFLPVSSSGHLELGKAVLGTDIEKDLAFTVIVHGATVLSTIVVFFREIFMILKESLAFKYNDSVKYLVKIVISMIPVLFVGIFLKDFVESFFGGRIAFVGAMLLITATFLLLTKFIKNKEGKNISKLHAFFIGIAQAFAVLPGISRSGITIATGLLLRNKREEVAKFSFLMVLLPIIGANILEITGADFNTGSNASPGIYLAGFIAAFLSGIFACNAMLRIVKRGNLVYFAVYCYIVGFAALFLA